MILKKIKKKEKNDQNYSGLFIHAGETRTKNVKKPH